MNNQVWKFWTLLRHGINRQFYWQPVPQSRDKHCKTLSGFSSSNFYNNTVHIYTTHAVHQICQAHEITTTKKPDVNDIITSSATPAHNRELLGEEVKNSSLKSSRQGKSYKIILWQAVVVSLLLRKKFDHKFLGKEAMSGSLKSNSLKSRQQTGELI